MNSGIHFLRLSTQIVETRRIDLLKSVILLCEYP